MRKPISDGTHLLNIEERAADPGRWKGWRAFLCDFGPSVEATAGSLEELVPRYLFPDAGQNYPNLFPAMFEPTRHPRVNGFPGVAAAGSAAMERNPKS